jgi:quinol monooxygenase YgiN
VKIRKLVIVIAGMLCLGMVLLSEPTMSAQQSNERLVRIAELEIDPAHLDAYEAALRQEIAASIQKEVGVLALYAVSVKDKPNQIRLFEIYANAGAYQAHLQSDHFKKYKSETVNMVQSLRLIETEPILLGAK